MTARSLYDSINNALDFLIKAELALYASTVALHEKIVTWHGSSDVPFLVDYGHATSDQYLQWLVGGHYSALMRDGSLLQLTYKLEAGEVCSHRLAYVPCPVIIDEALLLAGEPVADQVEKQLSTPSLSAVALRSPVRFDFDPAASSETHPAAHMTINGPDCRIACVAPLHPYRFIDFVFRQFYPILRASHKGWFDEAADKRLGSRVLSIDDARGLHVMWSAH